MSYDEVRETMSFVLGGDDELDIETFTSILSNTSKILKKTTQFSRDGEYQKFVISNVRKGSFIVDLTAIIALAPQLIETSTTALSMFKTFLDIKAQISNSNVKEVTEKNGNVYVETNNGVINNYNIPAFNAYTEDSEIDDRITSMMRKVSKDKNISSLKLNHVSSSGEEVTEYSPSLLSEKADLTALNAQLRIEQSRVSIKISKVDFEGNSKWQGYIGMAKENFYVSDDNFKKNIGSFSFTIGTVLDCDIEIAYNARANGIPIEGTKYKYTVIKVHKVIEPTLEKQEGIDWN